MNVAIYLVVGVFWGGFAVKKQKEIHPEESTLRWTIPCFVINMLIWPIGMVMALYSLSNDLRTD